MIDYGRLRTDLLALAVLAATVFITLSLASFDPADPPTQSVWPAASTPTNLCGQVGAQMAYGLIHAFGLGAWFLVIGVVVFDFRLFANQGYTDPLTRLIGASLMLVAICMALQLTLPALPAGSLAGSGGYLGACGVILLREHFSTTGSLILLSATGIAGLLLTGEVGIVRAIVKIALLPLTIWARLAFRPVPITEQPLQEPTPADAANVELPETVSAVTPAVAALETPPLVEIERPVAPLKPSKSTTRTAKTLHIPEEIVISAVVDHEDIVPATTILPPEPEPTEPPAPPLIKVNPPATLPAVDHVPTPLPLSGDSGEIPFMLPSLDLLEDAEDFPYEILAKKAQIAAATLEKTFKEFGLNIKVVEIDTGPVITQYELELEAGLRLSKVTALADDLAIALRVPSVRVVAPIPGRNTVGVEVPNDDRVMVRLKELLQGSAAELDKQRLPLFFGKDVSGRPLVVDMCKLPHLLIAGRTGTGKSVCLNTLILSLLMTRSPEQVKMLMIDPKMVELSPYMRIPHLMHPVITDMKKAEAVLGWAVDKMEERYDLLARVGVRHLDGYNKLGKEVILQRLGIDRFSEEAEQVPEHMPYIVIIADEMADMMMTSGKDVEAHIIRLAQKSRAVGIHLVLATQKPTVDVITGLIKSNLPARISFQVSSRVDSRVVLDEMGAEKLLGNGDMLYLAPGTSNLYRAQGTYVSDEEVMRIIDYYSDQEPQYSAEIAQVTAAAKAGEKAAGGEPRERDDLYPQACETVIREGRGSTSLLQRAMGIGYGRAARMIDWMAEDGIVGSYNGSQAREVIISMEEWEDSRSNDLVGV